ncbi:MAG: hypothetical protein R6U95_02940 [Bacteroidales bacterium]
MFVVLTSIIPNITYCQNPFFDAVQHVDDSFSEEEMKELEDTYVHKLAINTAQFEDYSVFFFLSEFQKKSLYNYVQLHKPIRTPYEFMYVLGFTPKLAKLTAALCSYETGIYSPNVRHAMSHGKHSVSAFYSYLPVDDSVYMNEYNYSGKPLKTVFRYRYSAYNKIKWGLTLRNDMGEPQQQGFVPLSFDYASAYVQISDVAAVSDMVLGDYQVSLGQGLVIKQGGFFSSRMGSNPFVSKKICKAHTSTNQFDFSRGSAATISVGDWRLSPFVSYKKIDGYEKDSSHSVPFQIYSTGMHRTRREIICKKAVSHAIHGLNASYHATNSYVGIGYVHQRFKKSKSFDFSHITMHGAYHTQKTSVFGEFAVDNSFESAYVYGINHAFSSYCNANVLFRHYDKNYQSFLSHGFSRKSSMQNEYGIYADITTYFMGTHTLNIAYDRYVHPYVDARSQLVDGHRITASWDCVSYDEYSIQYAAGYYATSVQEHSQMYGEQIQQNRIKHQLKCKYIFSACESRSVLSFGKGGTSDDREFGYVIAQDFVFSNKPKRKIYVRTAYFDAPFNARIYAYQPTISQAYVSPQFLYNGYMTAVVGKYAIRKGVQVQFQVYTYWYKTPQHELPSHYTVYSHNNKISCSLLLKYQI